MSFVREIFNGFFNFEAKFWNTLIPLLIKPGKVSEDYIKGKRQRYSNPFRFYLTVSIIFFLIVGLHKTVQKFEALANDTEIVVAKTKSKIQKKQTQKDLDSLKTEVNNELKNFIIPVPKKMRNAILEEVDKQSKDSTLLKKDASHNSVINLETNLDNKLEIFIDYIKKHPKANINNALDALGYQKNFTNRFLYTRAESVYAIKENKETRSQFFNQLLSYGSIALFIFLPIFTLFLKVYYIRSAYTYVEHLIFVFHIQTVFFMLFTIYFIFLTLKISPALWVFLSLFLVYLYIAMKNFYKQSHLKTALKFLALNSSFGFVASFGIIILFLISFAFF